MAARGEANHNMAARNAAREALMESNSPLCYSAATNDGRAMLSLPAFSHSP